MRRLSCSLLTGVLFVGSLAGGGLSAQVQTPARDDDYWSNHWSWYDSTYRPYYSRGSRYRYNDSNNRYDNWQPGPYSSRVPPRRGEGATYVPGPSGGRVYNTPGPVTKTPLRYGWW